MEGKKKRKETKRGRSSKKRKVAQGGLRGGRPTRKSPSFGAKRGGTLRRKKDTYPRKKSNEGGKRQGGGKVRAASKVPQGKTRKEPKKISLLKKHDYYPKKGGGHWAGRREEE